MIIKPPAVLNLQFLHLLNDVSYPFATYDILYTRTAAWTTNDLFVTMPSTTTLTELSFDQQFIEMIEYAAFTF